MLRPAPAKSSLKVKMFGFLNIDKPAGMTSRDVVNRVQRLVRPAKTGHAGTLDPLATGVLVVGVGAATRLVEYVQRLPKTYLGTFFLGRESDTEDTDGTVVELPDARVPTQHEIEAILPRFLGTIQQRPPAYSALMVAGQRAYQLARRGEQVELSARPIEIHSLEIVRYDYPELELLVSCGSGTYIRSLGRDIAEALDTAAVMSQLRRLAIGPFHVDEALQLSNLSPESIAEHFLPPHLAVSGLTQITVSEVDADRLFKGQTIAEPATLQSLNSRNDSQLPLEIAALRSSGDLIAIVKPEDGRLRPRKCFGIALEAGD